MPAQLRMIFSVMLVSQDVSHPSRLWNEFKSHLSEDIIRRWCRNCSVTNACDGMQSSAEDIALYLIDYTLRNYRSSLKHFRDMPLPTQSYPQYIEPTISSEYQMLHFHTAESRKRSFTEEQQHVYNKIREAIQSYKAIEGGTIYHPADFNPSPYAAKAFFLDAPGGCGKTFLLNTLIYDCLGKREHVIATASSGVAALLLQNGRTAHSAFGLPIPIEQDSVSTIAIDSDRAKTIRNATFVLWDEAPMLHRYTVETLDRFLRDLMKVDVPFGGKVVLFSGDFRQILPVIKRGSATQIINATLSSAASPLWKTMTHLKLTQNMRASSGSSEYASWVLRLGNGELDNPIPVPQAMRSDCTNITEFVLYLSKQLHISSRHWRSRTERDPCPAQR